MEEKLDVQDKLKNRSLIRSADLVASLPAFDGPIQFSRVEGENQRFGVFALYDRTSSTMVICRYFHDCPCEPSLSRSIGPRMESFPGDLTAGHLKRDAVSGFDRCPYRNTASTLGRRQV